MELYLDFTRDGGGDKIMDELGIKWQVQDPCYTRLKWCSSNDTLCSLLDYPESPVRAIIMENTGYLIERPPTLYMNPESSRDYMEILFKSITRKNNKSSNMYGVDTPVDKVNKTYEGNSVVCSNCKGTGAYAIISSPKYGRTERHAYICKDCGGSGKKRK